MTMTIRFVGDGWGHIPAFMGIHPILKQFVDDGLESVGEYLVDTLKKNIMSKGALLGERFEPNAPLTIQNKGFDQPLYETGQMLQSITMEPKADWLYFVGISDSRYIDRAVLLENGGITEINGRMVFIPPRPFIEPLYQEKVISKSMKLFTGKINLMYKAIKST